MKIAVIGSREYPSPERVGWVISHLPDDTEIVSGGARGVDTWAEQAARKRCLPIHVYPANWDKYGKSAGYRRNAQIIAEADMVVAFWDGKSRGTRHSMDLARQMDKPLTVFGPDGKKVE